MNMTDVFSLDGRVAVVTGGTRGLGAAFATMLASAGADIAVAARGQDGASGVVERIESHEVRGRAYQTDVTRRDHVERLLDDVVADLGRVDILINNAGTCVHAPALEITDEDWSRVVDVNLHALWQCCQVFGDRFVGQGSGTIVNIGSISGQIVNRPQWQPAYNASKAAVHQLTKSLAAEWAPHGVRVNALAPGYVATEMAPVDDPQFRPRWVDDAPMRRAADPDEIAPSVLYLASDASSFTTGSVLVADGGYTLF